MNRATIAWIQHLKRIMNIGALVDSREGVTLELLNKSIRYDMHDWTIEVPERKLNQLFIIDEAAFALTGGIFPHTTVLRNVLAPWLDASGAYSGAYGPKLMGQMPYILDVLRAKPDTRQAVINIWPESPRSSFEAPQSKDKIKNVPCLVSMQFLRREDALHCFVTMRSSDAWLGLPNDMGVYALIAQYVARAINADYGDMMLNMHSAHIYEKHFTKVEKIIKSYVGVPNAADD